LYSKFHRTIKTTSWQSGNKCFAAASLLKHAPNKVAGVFGRRGFLLFSNDTL